MKKIWKKVKKHFRSIIISMLILLYFITPLLATLIIDDTSSQIEEISYVEFQDMVKKGLVSNVYLDYSSPEMKFEDKNEKQYITDNPRAENFKKNLLESGVKVTEVNTTYSPMYDILAWIIQLAVIYIIITLTMKSFRKMVGFNNQTNKSLEKPTQNYPKVNFSNIAGNEEAKEEMKFLVEFLKNPSKYTDAGAKLPKGVIFYGPPGTGKTLMARAIAGEAKVPFFSVSGSDFMELYVGVGAKRVRELFDKARKNAPCIVFIDEIDAVGGSRGLDSNSERDQTINALLNEMDGFNGSEGIIVIAGTNLIEKLDRALIRPGRFDKHIPINLPDCKDRYEILKLHSRNKKFADDVNLEELAKMTIGFAGAGLESLLNESVILSINRGRKVVTNKDIEDAYFKIVMKGDKKKNLKDRKDEEIDLVAWHEAGHALCAKLVTTHAVPKVTIIPTTSGAGGATFVTPHKMGLFSKRELLNDVMVNYAGRIGEYLLLGEDEKTTTGAFNDIKVATENLKKIVAYYGMSHTFGLINLEEINVDSEIILEEVSKLSKKLYEKTLHLLKENYHILKDIANALKEKETINEEELDSIISKHELKKIDDIPALLN